MKPLLIFAAIGLACSTPCMVQAATQQELNEQAQRDAKTADDALNTVYKKLMATLDDAAQAKLKISERAWVKFRDAECDFAEDAYRGGSIMPLVYWTCNERLTKARTVELETHVKERADH